MNLVIGLWLFYVFYLACMSLVRGHKTGTLSLISKILGYPIILVGLVIDVFMNVFVFSWLFFEFPKECLVTQRLKRHIGQQTMRAKIACFICDKILSPFDPSGNHCD